jgi:branched-subunit amino acid aminotransferase/4-amino-4-deoxychorismate lyase
VQIDQEWVPHHNSSSLYIRPTLIGTEPALGVSASSEAELYVVLCPVGPYFSTGAKAVSTEIDFCAQTAAWNRSELRHLKSQGQLVYFRVTFDEANACAPSDTPRTYVLKENNYSGIEA